MSIPFISLPRDRYNFQARNEASASLTAAFNQMMMKTKIISNVQKFYIDTHAYELIRSKPSFEYQEAILSAFWVFTSNSSYKNFKNGFLEINITDTNQKVLVVQRVVKSVLYHNLHLDVDKLDDVISDIYNNIERSVDLIPPRNKGSDGQMKIMVDAVLAVDALDEKDSLKITIIGSGHETNIQPRYAYDPMLHMITNSEVHMYDYVEEKGVSREHTNMVTRVDQGANYESLKDNDLVIDDVWANGKTSLMSEVLKKKSIESVYPREFSIKSFGERVLEANVYYQCSHTYSKEVRIVSRPVIPMWRANELLGDCEYCRELKYFLRGDYDIHFFKSVNMSHKHPCTVIKLNHVIEEISAQYDLVTNLEWVEAYSSTYHSREELERILKHNKKKMKEMINIDLSRMRQHPNDILDFDIVELRSEILQNVDFIVSSDLYVTRLIYESARNIYKIEDRRIFILKRPKKGIVVTGSIDEFEDAVNRRGYWSENQKKKNQRAV